jgi:N-formylglutamate deformylase
MTSPLAQFQRESNQSFVHYGPRPDNAIPLVIDSPHSSWVMPEGSGCIAPEDALRSGTDAYVDELWGAAPQVGAHLLCAAFHRSYIDANRNELDIDQEMLASPWPTLTRTSAKSRKGMGLIRRYALPGVPMYDRPLTVEEVRHRVRSYHAPYHARLAALVDAAAAQFGQVWHIDCHSMKSVGNAMNEDEGAPRPDLVISDADGTSTHPAHTAWFAGWWSGKGYTVSVNDPYKGGEIIRRTGKPIMGRHSIQIEINRKLYMDERSFRKTEGFDRLSADIAAFLLELRAYVLAKLQRSGAETAPAR